MSIRTLMGMVGLVLLSSPAGYANLERVEGRVLHVYPDSAGYHTIGVGHLLSAVELKTGLLRIGAASVTWKKGLTNAQAEALLHQDVQFAERTVSSLVKMPLLQNQFDALVSFEFNIGSGKFTESHLLVLVNRGDYADVPAEMRKWRLCDGVVNAGLVARRQRESAMWKGQS